MLRLNRKSKGGSHHLNHLLNKRFEVTGVIENKLFYSIPKGNNEI